MSVVFTPKFKGAISYDRPTLFLGGSIEMGNAIPWQNKVISEFKKENFTILNPRRDDWDSSWIQSIENPQFNEQVNWELDGIDRSDCVLFFIHENTLSPITLMELGYCAGKVHLGDLNRTVVYCREGFWRKGNVDIIASRNHIKVFGGAQHEFYEEVRAILNRNFQRRTDTKSIW